MCMAAALPMAGGYFLGKSQRKDEEINVNLDTKNPNFSGIEEEEQVTSETQGSNQPSQSSRTTDKAY